MAYHVRGPVLRYAHGDEAVEAHRGAEHEVGHGVVVGVVAHGCGRDLHHRLEQALGPAIHHAGIDRIGHILLHDVDEGVGKACGDHLLREREGDAGIEHREARKDQIRVEGELLMRCAARNYGAVVHLRSRSGQREHRSQRHCLAYDVVAGDYVPRLTLVRDGCGYELRAVDDRAAAYGQQEVHTLTSCQRYGLDEGLIFGIGLYAPELHDVATLQCLDYLIVYAVAFYAAAAEGEHDLALGGDLLGDADYGTLAEDELYGILKFEIVHLCLLFELFAVTIRRVVQSVQRTCRGRRKTVRQI